MHKKSLRPIAALMAAILMFLPCAQAASFSYGGNLNTPITLYLRMFVPGDDSPFTTIGHYDLMIEGTFSFRGKSFTNPVFSFRREDSRLDVFNEADTGRVYSHVKQSDYYYDCSLYQWKLELGSVWTLYTFLRALNSQISSSSKHPQARNGIKCKIKSSSIFSKYKASSINCFYAVATWIQYFGDSRLMNYYNAVHSGLISDYLPATLLKKYPSRFTLRYAP